MRIYYIEWTDSCVHHGWMPKKIAKNLQAAKCASAGFLVRAGKEETILAVNAMLDGTGYGDTITIPTKNITKRKRL